MKKILLGVALFALAVPPVLAADSGGYVTGLLGYATNEQDLNTSMSSGLLLGYRFPNAISAEVGYTSLYNNASLKGLPQNASGSATISGTEITGVYDFPYSSQVSFFGRAGYAVMSVSANITSGTLSTSTSATESGLLFGAGVKYKIDSSFGLQAGLNSYYLSNNSGSDNPINWYVAASIFF